MRAVALIVACFASHIHRVQQVADAAQSFGRRVATLGLSMKKNVTLARKLGVLRIPDSALIDIEDIESLPPGEVCVISTGSQGEPMSALARSLSGDNRWLEIQATTPSSSARTRSRATRPGSPRSSTGSPASAPRWSTPATWTSTPPATPSRRS